MHPMLVSNTVHTRHALVKMSQFFLLFLYIQRFSYFIHFLPLLFALKFSFGRCLLFPLALHLTTRIYTSTSALVIILLHIFWFFLLLLLLFIRKKVCVTLDFSENGRSNLFRKETFRQYVPC